MPPIAKLLRNITANSPVSIKTTAYQGTINMGYQDSNHKFVSELTSAEIKECRNRAAWLAEHWFTQSDFRTIDLDETPTYGKIHAIVGESYSNNELRIR